MFGHFSEYPGDLVAYYVCSEEPRLRPGAELGSTSYLQSLFYEFNLPLEQATVVQSASLWHQQGSFTINILKQGEVWHLMIRDVPT